MGGKNKRGPGRNADNRQAIGGFHADSDLRLCRPEGIGDLCLAMVRITAPNRGDVGTVHLAHLLDVCRVWFVLSAESKLDAFWDESAVDAPARPGIFAHTEFVTPGYFAQGGNG